MADLIIKVSANFGDFHLDVDMALPGRGVSAFFGPSGSGKSLLLRAIAGLEQCPAATILINGETWQEGAYFMPAHERAVGVVFQDARLFDHLNVQGNLDYGRRRALNRGQTPFWGQTPNAVIELLGIAHLLGRMPAKLSGGERQRVAIARALLTHPQLLLLDEPLASLDHARKQEILPYLERLHDELDIPIIYVSHDPGEVMHLADHLVVLENGRAVRQGALKDLVAQGGLTAFNRGNLQANTDWGQTPKENKPQARAAAPNHHRGTMETKPPLPPFTLESAAQKVRMAEDAWNSRDPDRVVQVYTEDTRWRNRAEFPVGRAEVRVFLQRKWAKELDYRLIKELWATTGHRIAVRFAYEWHDDSGQWYRSYGNENWEFNGQGLMQRRFASINDCPIKVEDRLFHWPLGRRPDDHAGLSDLGL